MSKVFQNPDRAGNFYATGVYTQSITIDGHTLNANGQRWFMGQFNSAGTCQWLTALPDSVKDIETDREGNIYMIRHFTGSLLIENTVLTSEGAMGFCLIKYKPDLSVEWIKKGDVYTLTSPYFDVAIDNNNDVILSAGFIDSLNFDNRWYDETGRLNSLITKIESNGSHAWSTTLGNCYPLSMRTDVNNSLLFIAHIHDPCYIMNTLLEHPGDIGHYYLVRYNKDGVPDLVRSMWDCYKEESPVFDTDGSANIYVLHNQAYNASSLTKYDRAMNLTWQQHSVVFGSILIDDHDRIFLSGQTYDPSLACNDTIPEFTCAYAQMDTSGNCVWKRTLVNGDYDHNAGLGIAAVIGQNKLIAAGGYNIAFTLDTIAMSQNSFHTFIAGIDLDKAPNSISGEAKPMASFSLFPNPASTQVSIGEMSASKIVIRDITGRAIYHNDTPSRGAPINVGSFPDGIYIVEISDENGRKTSRKLIVQK